MGFIDRVRSWMTARSVARILAGQFNAQLPEVGSAVATYYAFRDKAYATDLALFQVWNTAAVASVAGLITTIAQTEMSRPKGNQSRNNGNKNQGRKSNSHKGGK